MKRWMRRFCAFLVVCMLLSLLPVAALAETLQYTDKYGTWTYQEEADGSVTIIGCENTKKNIVIPKMVDGKPVRRLGAGLFKDNATITAVVIPYGVRIMEEDVFFGCTKLERVELPYSLTAIGDKAFAKCETLKELFVPSSVEELGADVFADSPQLDVSCYINSEMARYLKDNKTDVASFTLIDVAVSQDVEPTAPAQPDDEEPEKPEPTAPAQPDDEEPEKPEPTAPAQPDDEEPEKPEPTAPAQPDDEEPEKPEPTAPAQPDDEEPEKPEPTAPAQPDDEEPEKPEPTAPAQPDDEEPGNPDPTDPGDEEQPPVIEGKLVTYNFGKTIGGKPEYTFVLADSMPDLILEDYVLQDSDPSHPYKLDNTLPQIMQNRFQLVSLSKYDGTSTETFDCQRVDVEPVVELRLDINEGAPEVSYGIVIRSSAQLSKPFFNRVEFNSDNNLMKYANLDGSAKNSLKAGGDGNYVQYRIRNNSKEWYFADGTADLARSDSHQIYSVQRFGVAGKCVDIEIKLGGHWEEKTLTAYDSANKESITAFTNETTTSENRTHYKSDVKVSEDGVCTEKQYVEAEYAGDQLIQATKQSAVKGEQDGTYNVTDSKIGSSTQPDSVSYQEHVVRANNVQEARDRLNHSFPNEPDERTNEVSERTVNTDGSTHTVLKDHRYIGETGKYVGWDWEWCFATPQDDTASLSSYTVTEYKYSSGEDSWTKTVTTAKPKQGAGTGEDFQNTVPEKEILLRDYDLSSFSYVYDPTVESGMDNWLESTSVTPNPSDDQQLAEHIDTILGNTSMEVEGKTLEQQKAKENLLTLAEDLKNPDGYKPDFFTEVVEETPDGTELLKKVEGLAESGQLPKSNTDELLYHYHEKDGSGVTLDLMVDERPHNLPYDYAVKIPKDDGSESSAPTESAPAETTSAESASVESAPVEAAAVETTSEESAPVESAAVETASEESAPVETAAEETASVETTSEETASEESVSAETTSEETASEESVSEETVPEESVSEEIVSEESVSEETASEESTSEETASEETAPVETVSEESVSEETVSEETVSEESVSEEIVSEEIVSEEIVSEESASVETASVETASVESGSEEKDIIE